MPPPSSMSAALAFLCAHVVGRLRLYSSIRPPVSAWLLWCRQALQVLGLWELLRAIRKEALGPRLCGPGDRSLSVKRGGLKMLEGCKTVRLSRGNVCYRLEQPDPPDDHATSESPTKEQRLPLVVLVHGFVGSHAYFEEMARTLVHNHGRRVLRYDNYGRGHSDWDGSEQSEGLFTAQLFELLHAIGEGGHPVDIVGYSMGGAIAAHFAKTYPSLVHSLSLLSPVAGDGEKDATLLSLSGNSLAARFVFWLYHHTPGWVTLPIRTLILQLLLKDDSDLWDNSKSDVCRRYQAWVRKRIVNEWDILSHSIFQSLRDFPLFGGAKRNYGAFGGHVPGDEDCAYAFPVFVGWGARDSGPSTAIEYAAEVFTMCGGSADCVRDEDRKLVLHDSTSSHSSSLSRTSPSSLSPRQFRWFRGSHIFAVEHGKIVANHLSNFWDDSGQLLRWRDARVEDVPALVRMIEKNYKLGDDFFVDYDRKGRDGGAMQGKSYTRTSETQIRGAIKGSCATFVSDAGAPTDSPTDAKSRRARFLVGVSRMAESEILACVQVHACPVPQQAEVSFLTVDSSIGKKGVARECMGVAERTARSLGFSTIAVDVVSTKPWLVKFYEKMGFKVVEGKTSPWPASLVEFLRSGYEGMFFYRQAKTL